ncbi:MAG TPA: zf-HC2 domain-containing protein, partial [Actinomycetota bacterium]
MNHERAQLLVSARMDGEHVRSREAEAADAHLASCARCRAFADRSARVRSAVRIRPAETVPDLTERIMAAVSTGNVRP